MGGRWVDLREAAEILDTTTEAVRKRAARGSLRSDRHEGRVVVWVDEVRTEGGREAEIDGGPLVEVLRDQVADLRTRLDREQEANRENRRIIAALTSRIPELEPAREPSGATEAPGGSENGAEGPEGSEPRPGTGGAQEGAGPVSWWRRVFGG